jgi:hypothetical protein
MVRRRRRQSTGGERLKTLSGINNVVRLIKTSSIDKASFLRDRTAERLEELGVQPDASKAVKGIPAGSDQVDTQSVMAWLRNVNRGDKAAIDQLISLNATAEARLEG